MPAGAYVDDVTVVVALAGSTAYVRVDVAAGGSAVAALGVGLRDASGALVASNATTAAPPGGAATLFLTVPNAKQVWRHYRKDGGANIPNLLCANRPLA